MTVLALEDELARALGRRVEAVHSTPAAYRSSHTLEELDVTFQGGESLRLLRKDLAPESMLAPAAGSKPQFVVDPRREIDVYRQILGPLAIDAPRLLASVVDERAGRYWLLLEIVDGVPLWQMGELPAWLGAARWLAALHLRSVPRVESLARHDDARHRVWLSRARRATPEGALDPVVAVHDEICRRLDAWPAGLVHGEFYASNVLVCGAGFRVIDWEAAGQGPGLLDLAALISGDWNADDREAIVRAYYSAWQAGGGSGSLHDLHATLACARVQIALQWLGWSSTWRPPAEHAQDWLGEALAAVAEVER